MILVVFPIIVAYIFSSVGQYYNKTLFFFLILSCLAVINSVIFIYIYQINSNEFESYKNDEEITETDPQFKDQEKSNEFNYGSVNNNFISNDNKK